MVAGIHFGTEVIPADDAITGTLDTQSTLCRDAVLDPLGNGRRGYLAAPSELGLRANLLDHFAKDVVLDDGCQEVRIAEDATNRDVRLVSHGANVIHGRFTSVNRQVIAHKPPGDEHGPMNARPMPQPENYANFAAWVRALLPFAGNNQAALARAVGVKPQMLTKYLAGGGPSMENLEKFADYAGTSYAKLRLLVDGRPVSEAKVIRDRINQTSTPLGAQIGRQWESIQDERMRNLIAEQIKVALEAQSKLESATRKRAG
jgi:transcriptional regulator with XRE-family HTH domain